MKKIIFIALLGFAYPAMSQENQNLVVEVSGPTHNISKVARSFALGVNELIKNEGPIRMFGFNVFLTEDIATYRMSFTACAPSLAVDSLVQTNSMHERATFIGSAELAINEAKLKLEDAYNKTSEMFKVVSIESVDETLKTEQGSYIYLIQSFIMATGRHQ